MSSLSKQTSLSKKMLIETLSVCQSLVSMTPFDEHRKIHDINRLQWLINQIESDKIPGVGGEECNTE
jgi:hypothetical protein